MKIFPRDQYGVIPVIVAEHWSVVWSWPHDRMPWFLWSRGTYRIGPVTFYLHRKALAAVDEVAAHEGDYVSYE
ncbi:MAG: hypothetical protein ACM3IH_14090 [Sphingobacteriales bacterium]